VLLTAALLYFARLPFGAHLPLMRFAQPLSMLRFLFVDALALPLQESFHRKNQTRFPLFRHLRPPATRPPARAHASAPNRRRALSRARRYRTTTLFRPKAALGLWCKPEKSRCGSWLNATDHALRRPSAGTELQENASFSCTSRRHAIA